MNRIHIASIFLSILLVLVVTIFWQQELKFLSPTPVPANYRAVAVKEQVDLKGMGVRMGTKPVLLHFFNPNCPCSRFSTSHFISLVKEWQDQVDFQVVLQLSTDTLAVSEMLEEYGLKLPIILDQEETLAKRCGVYATPQAVILQQDASLYYRGNYNRSRYCTDQQTSYARLALAALVQGAPAPQFSELATTAYGCELATEQSSLLYFLSL